MLKDYLTENNGNCFKLVCGAGNEDVEEVKRLVYIYSKAGCRFFDLSANLDVINVAKEAIELTGIKDKFYLCVSVGIKNDPHVNKAVIDYDKCISCGSCENVCLQSAIKNIKVKQSRCIGCGKCAKVCPKNAISYISCEKELEQVLPAIFENGIDCVELHAMGLCEEEIANKWNYICENFKGIVSLCTSRGKLSDEALVKRIKNMIKNRDDYTTIIQADGFPMSGGKDDYKTTLQAVATAEIVQNENLPVYILLSGGTNSKTAKLAKMCGIKYNGISVGSYARKIVKQYIQRETFWDKQYIQDEAILVAKNLIESLKIED